MAFFRVNLGKSSSAIIEPLTSSGEEIIITGQGSKEDNVVEVDNFDDYLYFIAKLGSTNIQLNSAGGGISIINKESLGSEIFIVRYFGKQDNGTYSKISGYISGASDPHSMTLRISNTKNCMKLYGVKKGEV